MYRRFPKRLLALLRCSRDAGTLAAEDAGPAIADGEVRCERCGRRYPVSGGILSLMDASAVLDGRSATEMRVRDEQAGSSSRAPAAPPGPLEVAEIVPTLAALEPLAGTAVLEVGCGNGRFTVPILRGAGTLVAVDFSRGMLAALARELPDDDRVGLVQADVTRLATADAAFDRVFSTLVSNLPTDLHREAMYRMAARALRDGGRFVFSAHHLGLRERMRRAPREGVYSSENPIYRRLFVPAEILVEARRHFGRLRCRRVQSLLPFSGRMPFAVVALSRLAERVPGLNWFAHILLFTAERPAVADRASSPGAGAA